MLQGSNSCRVVFSDRRYCTAAHTRAQQHMGDRYEQLWYSPKVRCITIGFVDSIAEGQIRSTKKLYGIPNAHMGANNDGH